MLERFKKLCERYGCKIVPVSARINSTITRRPDILAVERHGEYIMCIPRKMYGFPNKQYKDLLGYPMWDYFKCENFFLSKMKMR